jgi:Escherichia/Staphylococcus phage prohead protease
MADVDNSAWDGNRAMREATTTAEYDRICALDRGASITALRERFGLPHHYLSKAPIPNVAGVRAARNALAGGRTGRPMTGSGIPEARAHLDRHWAAIQAASRSASTTIEHRSAPVALELREDGRTLAGLAVPYGIEVQIGRYRERFAHGAFADADPASVPLFAVHEHEALPIGRALSLTETKVGLEAELRVSKTQAGDDVLELVRDGAATGLSVGFVPVEDRWNATRTIVERIKARLVELSITAFPAYEDARILAVRQSDPPVRTPRLTVARWS